MIADQFNFFSECLPKRIGGELDLVNTPENNHFGIDLIGLHDRQGMRLLAQGGYRALLQNPVFVEDSRNATGQINYDNQSADGSGDPNVVDFSGSCQVRSRDRFSRFILATTHGGSKIIGAQYMPALKQPHLAEGIPWHISVLKSLCMSGLNISFDAWVYDQTKKAFYSVGSLTIPDTR